MLALIIVSSIFLYMMIGTFVFLKLTSAFKVGRGGWDNPGPFFGGLSWPVLVPIVLAVKIVNFLNRTAKKDTSGKFKKKKDNI